MAWENAADVIPPARVEADEPRAERRPDFHQLETGLELLDQHVGLDRRGRQPQLGLERRQDVVPERRFLRGLDLRQVEDE